MEKGVEEEVGRYCLSDRNYSGPETSFSIGRGGTPILKILCRRFTVSWLAEERRRRGGKVRAAGEFFVFRTSSTRR